MKAERTVILHSEIPGGAGPDEADVLDQVKAVQESLAAMEMASSSLAFNLDVLGTIHRLLSLEPHFVFNLVETVQSSGRLIHMAPAVLDLLRIPYSGAKTEAIFLTSHKIIAKKMLRASGIDTPDWATLETLADGDVGRPFIIKSVWEHGSLGMDDASVVCPGNPGDLREAMVCRAPQCNGECFAEAYVDGREFNLSILGRRGVPQVLPPAEISFQRFADGKPRVVGYRAKWNQDSFEYRHTQRIFEFEREDLPLLQRLEEIALDCWRIFELRGYARVDFRVDEDGKPWVLEVNTNPCLSPDAGFMAAAERTGMSSVEVVRRIVEDSLPPSEHNG
jgi:D-alanine-D-alanine ligase